MHSFQPALERRLASTTAASSSTNSPTVQSFQQRSNHFSHGGATRGGASSSTTGAALRGGGDEWQIIDNTIQGIANGTMAQYSFQSLHSAVVRMVSHDLGDLLHQNLQTKLRASAASQLQDLFAAPVESFLSTLQRIWLHYSRTVQRTSDFLYHFNRMYCEQKHRPGVRELGLRIFGEEAFSSTDQTSKLRVAFLRAVDSERETGVVSLEGECIGSVAKGLADIDTRNLFEPLLETPYLQQLDRYHTDYAKKLTEEMAPKAYVVAYWQQLEAERERGSRCLASRGSVPKIESRLQEVWLIRTHLPYLLQVGPIHDLLRGGESHDTELETLFQTIASVGEAEALLLILRKYFVAQLEAETQVDVTKFTALRKRLLQLSRLFTTERLERLLDAFVQGTLTEAVAWAGDAFPAALVKYLDESIRTLDQDQLEVVSEECVILFRYVPAKDLFEGGCKVALAKRLLGNASMSHRGPYNSDGSAGLSSLEREMIFLRALKKDCGTGMVKKMEGMLSDIRESFEVTQQFLGSQTGSQAATALSLDVSLAVLASGYWPVFPPLPLRMPQSLVVVEDALKKFYAGRHGGRRLAFCTSQGALEIRVLSLVSGNRYEVSCPLLTGICLLQFTDDQPKGVAEVAELVGAPAGDVLRSLAGLCKASPTAQGLLQSTDRPITAQSLFTFNANIRAKTLRWRVAPATVVASSGKAAPGAASSMLVDEEGGEATQPPKQSVPSSSESGAPSQPSTVRATVEEDRRHKIDAAIVRVMKSRRSLDFQALIAETCRLLSNQFVPTAEQLKKRVDVLLERDFLERSKDQPNVFLYLS